jgi:hypothetical protein
VTARHLPPPRSRRADNASFSGQSPDRGSSGLLDALRVSYAPMSDKPRAVQATGPGTVRSYETRWSRRRSLVSVPFSIHDGMMSRANSTPKQVSAAPFARPPS